MSTNPQSIQFDVGGTISVDVQSLANAVTVLIRDGDGVAKTGHVAATPSTVNTTTTGSIAAGATSMNVASATGVVAGGRLYMQDDLEEVLVSKISTLAVTLRRPVLYAHVNAAQVQGSRVTFEVNSAVASSLWWDGHAEWNIDGTMDYTAVACTRYPMTRATSTQDLFDLEPKLYDVLDGEQDAERLLDLAHDHVMGEIGKVSQYHRANVFPASSAFRVATALAALYIHYRRRGGEEARDLADRYHRDMSAEIASICALNPIDTDQDLESEADEKINPSTRRISRG